MKEAFQTLFDCFNHPINSGEYFETIKEMIFETISKEKFCSVMEMKFSKLSTT